MVVVVDLSIELEPTALATINHLAPGTPPRESLADLQETCVRARLQESFL